MPSVDSPPENLPPPFLHRITAHQLQVADFVIAGILIFLSTVHAREKAFPAPGLARHGLPSTDVGVVIGIAVLAGAAIAVRRRYPMSSLILLTLATAIAIVTGEAFFAAPF